MPNDCFSAKDRGIGVYDDAIFQRGMTLGAADKLTFTVGLEAERTQCHTLIQLDMFADFGCLADYHTRAVVDEEMLANRGARVDIDARASVGPLGHHAWNERYVEFVQHVCQPIDRDSLQSRIAEDHFVERLAGRV